MKNLVTQCLVAALVLTVAGGGLQAATYYVDQNHPAAANTNPGTEDLPFLTINKATGLATAGDEIIVKQGLYREAVGFGQSGAAGSPITLRAAPGQRVIVSGADAITNWQPATSAVTRGNANWSNIYYADIPFKPSALYQDEQPLEKARQPNDTWYIVEGGTTNTLVDTLNLIQPSGFWAGAEVFFWDTSITAQYRRDITSYDQSSSTLTIDGVWNSTVVPQAGNDRYYLMNKVEIVDRPGEWAVEPVGGGWRLFLWPAGGGSPDGKLIEGSRRDRFVLELGNKGYWVIDGLEIRHGSAHGIGGWSSACPGYNVVQNCSIHHNEGTGIYGRYMNNSVYRRNYVAYNGNGIANVGASYVTIEENEIAGNLFDGLLATGPGGTEWAEGVIIRRNFVHDHYMWGHPDNIQSYANIRDLLIEDNLIINAGQSYMMEATDRATFRGNTIIGSAAYMLIFGHSNTTNITLEHNTLFGSGYGLMNLTADGYHFRNNVFVKGHKGSMWGGVGPASDYSSDYNLFYHADGLLDTEPAVVWDRNYNWSLQQYVDASGHDSHSRYGNAQFVNAPVSFHQLLASRQVDFLENRVYVASTTEMAMHQVGDYIELDWDGVVRQITALGSDWVEFAPGDPRIARKSAVLINWKANNDFRLDLALKSNSPARGLADDGSDAGSSINMPQFMAGDFTGDGYRDIPQWPVSSQVPSFELTEWKVEGVHGSSRPMALSLEPGYVESRAVSQMSFRITFSAPLDVATLSGEVLQINGQVNGDVTALVGGLSLEDSGRTLVLDLMAPLPDSDSYTLTLSGNVRSIYDQSLASQAERQMGMLIGDADGSGIVTAADLTLIRAAAGSALSVENARYDVDGSGEITGQDLHLTRRMLGHVLP